MTAKRKKAGAVIDSFGADYLVRTLVQNGVALQNGLNQYAAQAADAIVRIDALIEFAGKVESRFDAVADELARLREESSEATQGLYERIAKIGKDG